jgi:hypothetical protein
VLDQLPHDESIELRPCAGEHREIPERYRVVDTGGDEGGSRGQHFESFDVR